MNQKKNKAIKILMFVVVILVLFSIVYVVYDKLNNSTKNDDIKNNASRKPINSIEELPNKFSDDFRKIEISNLADFIKNVKDTDFRNINVNIDSNSYKISCKLFDSENEFNKCTKYNVVLNDKYIFNLSENDMNGNVYFYTNDKYIVFFGLTSNDSSDRVVVTDLDGNALTDEVNSANYFEINCNDSVNECNNAKKIQATIKDDYFYFMEAGIGLDNEMDDCNLYYYDLTKTDFNKVLIKNYKGYCPSGW